MWRFLYLLVLLAFALALPSGAQAQPVLVEDPVLEGPIGEGDTLTIDPGTWGYSGHLSFYYVWYRIPGSEEVPATLMKAGSAATTHTVGPDDIGKRIYVVVYASDATGKANARSNTVGPLLYRPPVNVTPPVISGEPIAGETLTVSPGTWELAGSDPGPITYEYRWFRLPGSDHVGSARDYTPTDADVGHGLRAVVWAGHASWPGASEYIWVRAVYIDTDVVTAPSTTPPGGGNGAPPDSGEPGGGGPGGGGPGGETPTDGEQVEPGPSGGVEGATSLNLILGTVRADVLRGTSGRDLIRGRRGMDTIFAGRGDDIVYGGAGRDLIYGGSGKDRLFGGRGRDRLFGRGGADVLNVRDGWRDVANCGPGRDVVIADKKDKVAKNCEIVRRK